MVTFSSEKLIGIVKRSLTPNRPYHAQWLLTGRCNYRCRGCNVWRNQAKTEEVSTEFVKKGLKVLHDLGVIELVLSGGNPLIREDMDEIVDCASKYFITTVYDNGSMASERIDCLKKADFVAISLDTLSEKKFDYIRGIHGAWQTAMNTIQYLKGKGINVGVSPTISQLNLHEMPGFTRYFARQGIPVWYCLYSYDHPTKKGLFGIGKKADDLDIVDREGMISVCHSLVQLKRQCKGVFITDQTLTALEQLFLNGQRTWKCKALQGFFMIDSKGRVAGCHRKDPVASVLELHQIWNNSRLDALRREYSECRQCTYLCYIFYSLHSNVWSNLNVIWDQRKNLRELLSNMGKKN